MLPALLPQKAAAATGKSRIVNRSRMEPSLYRYILNHSKRDQILLILLSVASLPLIYITLELPKKIINLLEGMDIPEIVLEYELGGERPVSTAVPMVERRVRGEVHEP